MNALLEVESLVRRYGSLTAVADVTLGFERGSLCSVIGPNGAGKTTFFNLISGLVAPTSGRIRFDGRDITTLAAHRRVRAGIARTFQITEIFPELTLRQTLRCAVEAALGLGLRLRLAAADERRVEERVARLIELIELPAAAAHRVGELSYGDQRATEIALSLALQPQLLLLDEPTAGMGEQETQRIAGLIRRLHRSEHLTTVLIEHDMRIVFDLSDRIVVLAEGRVLADGAPAQIAADEAVQAAYLGTEA
ncbi:MAG: ABC transporter ATP-binding protein [Burkholderiales bacterium]|nr:ABC transporter ATP-binding protein [Burkholderiales bacterium]